MKASRLKHLFTLAAAALLIPCLTFAAPKKSTEGAEEFLGDLLSELSSTLTDKSLKKDAKLAFAEKQIRSAFSLGAMTNQTIGPISDKFSKEQYSEFAAAYREYLIHSYLERIASFKDKQIEIVSVSELTPAGTTTIEVLGGRRTTKTISTTKRATTEYTLEFSHNEWRITNVIVEGVNINSSYRSQFESMLRSSTPDEVITTLRELNAKNAKKNPFK